MKKLLISGFAVAFALGFNATAFAQTKKHNSAKSNSPAAVAKVLKKACVKAGGELLRFRAGALECCLPNYPIVGCFKTTIHFEGYLEYRQIDEGRMGGDGY